MEMFRHIQSEGKPVRWLNLGESSPVLNTLAVTQLIDTEQTARMRLYPDIENLVGWADEKPPADYFPISPRRVNSVR